MYILWIACWKKYTACMYNDSHGPHSNWPYVKKFPSKYAHISLWWRLDTEYVMFLKFPVCTIFLKYEFFASILIHQQETSGPILLTGKQERCIISPLHLHASPHTKYDCEVSNYIADACQVCMWESAYTSSFIIAHTGFHSMQTLSAWRWTWLAVNRALLT